MPGVCPSVRAPGGEAHVAQRVTASPSAETREEGGLRKVSEGTCWARRAGGRCSPGMRSACPAGALGGGWAVWPGLQCQDPRSAFSLVVPEVPVCSPSPPALVLHVTMKQVSKGATSIPTSAPSPCNSIFLLVFLTRVWAWGTQYLISNLRTGKPSVRQAQAQAARLTILGASPLLPARGVPGGRGGSREGRPGRQPLGPGLRGWS